MGLGFWQGFRILGFWVGVEGVGFRIEWPSTPMAARMIFQLQFSLERCN